MKAELVIGVRPGMQGTVVDHLSRDREEDLVTEGGGDGSSRADHERLRNAVDDHPWAERKACVPSYGLGVP